MCPVDGCTEPKASTARSCALHGEASGGESGDRSAYSNAAEYAAASPPAGSYSDAAMYAGLAGFGGGEVAGLEESAEA